MKIFKIMLVAVLTIFGATSIVQAAGQVRVNQSITVSVDVQNNDDDEVDVAVKLSGYDSTGNSVGHFCREVELDDESLTTVTFTWKAPSYTTGLYWTSKIEVDGDCPKDTADYSDVSDHDDDDHDDDDHDDDDHDDHDDDDHDDYAGDYHR